LISQSIAREVANSIIFPLCLCLCYVMARTWRDTIRNEPEKRTKRDLVVGLFFLFLGEGLRSGWAWIALASNNRSLPVFEYISELYQVVVIAAAFILLGALCSIKALAAPGKRYHGWTFAVVLVFVCVTVTLLI